MTRLLAIALGGAAGAVARYGLGLAVGLRSFPWVTLAINVVGSFALGYVLGGPGARWSATVLAAVTVGFLGAFTTFSTFAWETTELIRTGRQSTAALYVVASVLVGLVASAAGYLTGRST